MLHLLYDLTRQNAPWGLRAGGARRRRLFFWFLLVDFAIVAGFIYWFVYRGSV